MDHLQRELPPQFLCYFLLQDSPAVGRELFCDPSDLTLYLMCSMTKAIFPPVTGAISLPPLSEGLNAVQRSASGEQSVEDPPAAVCSVVLSASSPLSAGCILFSGSSGANTPPPACVRTDTCGTVSYLSRDSSGSSGGRVAGGVQRGSAQQGWFPAAAASLFSAAKKKFGISAQTPRGKLGRICSGRLRCSSSFPPSLLPLVLLFNGFSALAAAARRTLSSSVMCRVSVGVSRREIAPRMEKAREAAAWNSRCFCSLFCRK